MLHQRDFSALKGPVTASVIGHIIVLFLLIFGVPFIAHNPEVLMEPVPIEVISSAEFSEIENQSKPNEAQNEPEPPPMKKQAPRMVEETPPAPSSQSAAVPSPQTEAEQEKPEPVKKMNAPVPMEKPRIQPKPQEKPVEEPKPSQDNFNSLLKNLAENDDPVTPPSEQTEDVNNANTSRIVENRISMGEQNALLAQLAKCWNVPTGARYAEDLIVDLRLVINPDRTVQSAKVVDTGRYNRDSFFRAAADSALRAVRNPACSPLELPPEKYQEWRYLRLTFNPSSML